MEANNERNLHSSLKILVKTSFIVFIGIALSKILGYVYRTLIARYYGPEVYGLFSLAIMLSGWFAVFSSLGLIEGLLRFLPLYRGKKETEKIKYIVNFVKNFLIFTSIASGILLYLLSDFISATILHNPSLSIYLKIFSISIPLLNISSVFLGLLRAFEEISWYSFIFNILQNITKVFLLGVFIAFGMNANATAFSYILGLFIVLAAGYIVSRKKMPEVFAHYFLSKNIASKLKSDMWSYSLPMMFFGIVGTVFYWIDSFSIAYFRGATEVGFYNAATPIAALLTITPELFMQLFFPMITREHSRNNSGLIEQLSKQVTKWILICNIPIFAVLIIFPGAAINILFGSQYLVAENALRILSIGALISSIAVVSSNLMSMIGKSKTILLNVIIASIINFVLNGIFIPMDKILLMDNEYGLTGAALATLISLLVFNILFVIQTYRYLEIIPFRRKMVRLFIIAALPTTLLFYLRTIFTSNSLFVLGTLGACFLLVYILLIIASNSLDRNDIYIIKSMKNKMMNYNK